MKRTITYTHEVHPDVPPPVEMTAQPQVWQLYIDGQPFLGIPTTEPGACTAIIEHQRKIIATGRYEYVDVALRPERRRHEDASGLYEGEFDLRTEHKVTP